MPAKSSKKNNCNSAAPFRHGTSAENKTPPIYNPPLDIAERHVWQITPLRDVIVFLVVAVAFWLLYFLGDIFLPVFIAFILAEVFNPFVTLLEQRWSCPRPVVASAIVLVAVGVFFGFFAWLAPVLYDQFNSLTEKLPNYLTVLATSYGIDLGDFVAQLEKSIHNFESEPHNLVSQVFRTTGSAVGIVTTVFGMAATMLISLAVVLMFFYLFTWHFNSALGTVRKYLPGSRKQQIVALAERMDKVVGDFFRGRMLIALLIGGLLSAGWFLAGVPYWFFLGMVTGVLNIVPYLSIITWPIAVLLKYVDSLTAGAGSHADLLTVVIWPSAVYIAQCCLYNGSISRRLDPHAVDPERPDEHERGNHTDCRLHRWCSRRHMGIAVCHTRGRLHQNSNRGVSAPKGERVGGHSLTAYDEGIHGC